MADAPELLTDEQICVRLGITDGLFGDLIDEGVLPKGIRVGKKRVYWSAADIPYMLWLIANNHRFNPRPEIMKPETKKGKDD